MTLGSPQLDNSGAILVDRVELPLGAFFFGEPVLPQYLGETHVSRDGDIPRHRAMYSAAVDNVDELPAKFDFRRLFNEERRPCASVQFFSPLLHPSRKGAADSAEGNGAQSPRLINLLTENAVFALFTASGSRLAHGSCLFTPPGAA